MHEKKWRDRLIRLAMAHPDWALGFGDEVWWSRIARPHLTSWAEADAPLRLVEQTLARDDPDPKALACYGLLVREWDATGKRDEQMWLRFVGGRPVSGITTQFLDWCCQRLARQGKTALLLVWDNASWHVSKEVRGWIKAHRSAGMDQGAQPGGQAWRGSGADHRLPVANQESVAQSDRAEVDARQAANRRTGPVADGGRDRGTGLCVFRLRS